MGLFTYNSDFYPTPSSVIEQMMWDEEVSGKVILEPSAGKGDIVEWLQRAGAKEVIACEKDQYCQRLLAGKCRIVADDFLSVTSEQVSHINMIVMNPPFSRGVEHIQHAWNIAPAGCTIVALCNHANFNSYMTTNTQKLNEVIRDNGYRKNLGSCFKASERMTDVEVELIKLFKHGDGNSEFAGYVFDCFDNDAVDANAEDGLVRYNFIRDLVNRYKEAVSLFDAAIAAAERINDVACWSDLEEVRNDFGDVIRTNKIDRPLPIRFEACRRDNDNKRTGPVTHAEYRKELQKYYWKIIFRKMNMEKYSTKKLRDDINNFIESNCNRPFTMSNIYRVLNIVIQTNGHRMQKAIEEAFDLICSLSAENSTAGETWKTNANYMVNRRFIVDWITGDPCGYNWSYVNVRSYQGNTDKVEDICKALCYLTGRDYDKIGSLYKNVCEGKYEWGKWFEWGFFRCRGYKKGTMHFEFLDEEVWWKFNQAVAKERGWSLPKKTEKKRKK